MFAQLRRVVCAVIISLFVVVQAGTASGEPSGSGRDQPTAQADARADSTELAGGTRILLYGDSFTMGFSGDWTWRYRLWRHLKSSGTHFDFVGPRNDMREYVSRQVGSQGYRDPNFDRDHAALGGMTFGRPLWEVSTLVDDYEADVVVGFIGANDLTTRVQTPTQLVDKWRAQITAARTTRPGTSFVLVQMPDTWYAGITAYNAGLVTLAHELDTAESRVVATGLAQYDPYTDTYDFAHPSASGERKVADLVASTLASIGVGTGPRWDLMDPSPSVTWAPSPRVAVKAGTLSVEWDPVDYASAEDVHVTDVTAEETTGADAEISARSTGTSWTMQVVAGHRYRVWLSPVKGFLPMGTASVPLTVLAPVTAGR